MIHRIATSLGLLGLTLSVAHGAEAISADVWADNWFALYVNGEKVAEDSVSINTERSFNAESFAFSAERPFVLAMIAKDFKENDTGLEYIGSNRQQMGDGGVIAQFLDGAGRAVAVTNSGWRCMVTHSAPAQKSCANESNPVAGSGACGFTEVAEPAGWTSVGFDDSGWASAIEYDESTVRPKDGYDRISWDRSAKLIWGSDLEIDNTVLCRLIVE